MPRNSWKESDDHEKLNDLLVNSGTAGIRIKDKLLGIPATPSLRWQFDYTDIPKEDGRDFTQTLTEGLVLDISEGVKFEERFSIGTASRLRTDSDSVKWNGYLGLDYRIPRKEDLTLSVNYEHNGLAHHMPTESFSEDNFQTRLLWKF